MCCNNNRNRWDCGCRRPMPCCCPCCGGAMPMPLPSFPDWPSCGCQEREELEFPVYVSVPATMARGTANLSATVERAEASCGCGRG